MFALAQSSRITRVAAKVDLATKCRKGGAARNAYSRDAVSGMSALAHAVRARASAALAAAKLP